MASSRLLKFALSTQTGPFLLDPYYFWLFLIPCFISHVEASFTLPHNWLLLTTSVGFNNSSKCSNCYGPRAFGGPEIWNLFFIRRTAVLYA